MTVRAACLLALLFPVTVAAQVAVAESPAVPANVAKAQAYVDLSGTLFKTKDFAGALDALRKAEPLLAGDPSLGVARFNIARCLEELGRPVEAAAAYDLYLTQPDEARRQTRAREALAKLTTSTVATLAVGCAPATTKVRVGDGPTLACPAEIRVAAGLVVVHGSAPGFTAADLNATAVAGKRTDLSVVLSPLVAVPLPAQTSVAPAPPAGPAAVAVAPEPAPAEHSRILPYSLLAGGGASVGLGVAFQLLASAKRDDAGREQYGAKRDSLTSDFETRRDIAYIGYGVGVVSLGVGTYLLLRTPSDGPQPTAGVSPNGFWVIW